MVDQLTNFKPLDPGRVDTLEPLALQYWSRELHCTEAELMQAMSKVGDHATAVHEHLASRRGADANVALHYGALAHCSP